MSDLQPRSLTLSQLAGLANKLERDYNVLLYRPQKWIDWESPFTLPKTDVYIIKVDLEAQNQLTISYNDNVHPLPYESGMMFVLKR
jgi:hypothetical protein